ncbi:predicted protein [Histoplasma capsulatum var. duboisii H88]|uniref:Predicted protein n=1 Tax=Ajellomyces capsulatus (strain H88) TaxID=544711 RepID=F0UKM8_AJEC8|nr:predicted protein [Histoplasma capsulatum var. duboisii H88]
MPCEAGYHIDFVEVWSRGNYRSLAKIITSRKFGWSHRRPEQPTDNEGARKTADFQTLINFLGSTRDSKQPSGREEASRPIRRLCRTSTQEHGRCRTFTEVSVYPNFRRIAARTMDPTALVWWFHHQTTEPDRIGRPYKQRNMEQASALSLWLTDGSWPRRIMPNDPPGNRCPIPRPAGPWISPIRSGSHMPSRAGSAGTSAAGLGLAIFSAIGQGRLDCPIRHGCWFSLFCRLANPAQMVEACQGSTAEATTEPVAQVSIEPDAKVRYTPSHRLSGPAYHMWAAQFTNMWSSTEEGPVVLRHSGFPFRVCSTRSAQDSAAT